jgi:hypothetical protein
MEQIHSGPMTGRTVLVTGGSGGIGRATTLGLAAMGAHLAITGRDRGRTEDAAREIRAAGSGQVDVFVADAARDRQATGQLHGVTISPAPAAASWQCPPRYCPPGHIAGPAACRTWGGMRRSWPRPGKPPSGGRSQRVRTCRGFRSGVRHEHERHRLLSLITGSSARTYLAASLGTPDASSRPGQRRSAPGMAWQAELSARDRRAG